MTIHDQFATVMSKLDKKLGYALYRLGSDAPSWMIYTRIEESDECVYRAHYFLGVSVYAEWLSP